MDETFIQQYVNTDAANIQIVEPKLTFRQQLKSIVRNRIFLGIMLLIAFAILVPTLIYYSLYDLRDIAEKSSSTCLVDPGFMVPCGNKNITRNTCSELNCCYDDDTKLCYHYFPATYRYKSDGVTFLPTNLKTPFNTKALSLLHISVVEINSDKLQIILHDSSEDIASTTVPAEKSYTYNVSQHQNFDYLGIEVFRSTGENLLSTAKGPLIASDGYWEWTFHMNSEEIFGFGELRLKPNITKVIYKNKEDHNTLPVFMGVKAGLFHGVAVEHIGPLEVSVLPSRLVVMRSLAGSKIVLNVVTGPTPEDVTMQLRTFEFRPPPTWVLGPHICSKDGADLEEAIEIYRARLIENSGIEYYSDCFHQNLMSMLLTATEQQIKDVADVINVLRSRSKFVLSLPPQLPIGNYPLYNSAVQKDLLYKKGADVWPGTYFGQKMAYVDYSSERINEWIVELFGEISKLGYQLPDGIALIDNWPAEETYKMSPTDSFPYLSQDLALAMSNTTPWDATNLKSTPHILLHNNYGAHQLSAITKYNANLIIMTSSYQYGIQNPALIQNEQISWSNLKKMITKNIYHSIFGGPLVASSVCGSDFYSNNTQEPICLRWSLVAATMPMYKTVKDWPRVGNEVHTNYAKYAVIKALKRRRELFLYFYGYILEGKPIVRPMFYDFFSDNETLGLDEQYMVGHDFLVAQPILPNLSKLRLYLPVTSGGWYEFWDGEFYEDNGWTTVDVIDTDWVMFVRAGSIIGRISGKGLSLTVALDCERNCTALGRMGTAPLALAATEEVIRIGNVNTICGSDGTVPMPIKNVRIYKSNGSVKIKPDIDLCVKSVGDVITIVIKNYLP